MGVVTINIASFADTFPAKRFARIIEDFKKDPASQGRPLDILVCSLAIYKFVSTTHFTPSASFLVHL